MLLTYLDDDEEDNEDDDDDDKIMPKSLNLFKSKMSTIN